MLMIPAVYQGRKPAPDFTPDQKAMEAMQRFNEAMGKELKIESLNGLHPQAMAPSTLRRPTIRKAKRAMS